MLKGEYHRCSINKIIDLYKQDELKEELSEKLIDKLMRKQNSREYYFSFLVFTKLLGNLFNDTDYLKMIKLLSNILINKNYNESDFRENQMEEDEDEQSEETTDPKEAFLEDVITHLENDLLNIDKEQTDGLFETE